MKQSRDRLQALERRLSEQVKPDSSLSVSELAGQILADYEQFQLAGYLDTDSKLTDACPPDRISRALLASIFFQSANGKSAAEILYGSKSK